MDTWQEYDPFATNFIHVTKIPSFISSLKPPLGFKGCEEVLIGHRSVTLMTIIRNLNLRIHTIVKDMKTRDGYVYFPEVLWAMFFNLCGVSTDNLIANRQVKEIFLLAILKYPQLG